MIMYEKIITIDKNDVHGKKQKIACMENENERVGGFKCGIYSTIDKKLERELPESKTILDRIFENVSIHGCAGEYVIAKRGDEKGKSTLLIDGYPFLHCGNLHHDNKDHFECWSSTKKDFWESIQTM